MILTAQCKPQHVWCMTCVCLCKKKSRRTGCNAMSQCRRWPAHTQTVPSSTPCFAALVLTHGIHLIARRHDEVSTSLDILFQLQLSSPPRSYFFNLLDKEKDYYVPTRQGTWFRKQSGLLNVTDSTQGGFTSSRVPCAHMEDFFFSFIYSKLR
jgi:hypothetical protein